MKLEDRLIAFRKENGLSQNAVAEALDVSRQAVSRWETGAAVPSTENLMSLSRLYGVGLDTFVHAPERPGSIQPSTSADAPPTSQRRHITRRQCLIFGILGIVLLLSLLLFVRLNAGQNGREPQSDLPGMEYVDKTELGELEIETIK